MKMQRAILVIVPRKRFNVTGRQKKIVMYRPG